MWIGPFCIHPHKLLIYKSTSILYSIVASKGSKLTDFLFSLNIFIYFSEEHIQTQNRKFGTTNNIMKMKRMGKHLY